MRMDVPSRLALETIAVGIADRLSLSPVSVEKEASHVM